MLERERLLANLNIEKERLATYQRIAAKLDHDIRTPLSVISTSQEILSKYFERIDETKRRERLETIKKQLAYATELLNDLTLLQDVPTDNRSLQLAPHNLKVLCQITMQDVQETSGKRHRLRFEHDFEHEMVLIDDVLVNRILLNLLSNAVKYSAPGGEIQLVLRGQGDQIVLQVIDQGVGMAADKLQHIFDPFYRIDEIVDRVSGRGLGLSIVKDCVERQKGVIRVSSVKGEGTTFTVELPLLLPDPVHGS